MLPRPHVVRYGIVGTCCTLAHLGMFRGLLVLLPAAMANALAFVVAAQLNFVASSRWTWAERTASPSSRAGALLRLGAFNASAALGLVVNSVAFWWAYRVANRPPVMAALLAIAAGTSVTYLMCSRLVFPVSGARGVEAGRGTP